MKTPVRVKGSTENLFYEIRSPSTVAAVLDMLPYLTKQELFRVMERASRIAESERAA